ncbi:hypothetical protein Dimus_000328 [Dionaea muscipula]
MVEAAACAATWIDSLLFHEGDLLSGGVQGELRHVRYQLERILAHLPDYDDVYAFMIIDWIEEIAYDVEDAIDRCIHSCFLPSGSVTHINTIPGIGVKVEMIGKLADLLERYRPGLVGGLKQVSQRSSSTSLRGEIMDTVASSYHDLPYYLKPCFLYLATFAEDSEISAGMLTRMWIAEGFVIEAEGGEMLEDAAGQYLEQLISRSMVQVVRRSYTGKVETCRLQNIMRSFCLSISEERGFLGMGSSQFKCRRLIIINGLPVFAGAAGALGTTYPYIISAIDASRSSDAHKSLSLRSLQFGIDCMPIDGLITEDLNLQPVCMKFKLLRVLSLWGIQTSDNTLPDEIGTLKFLRYLGLRFTNITTIPQHIEGLLSLLTLDYRDIRSTTNEFDDFGVRNVCRVSNVLWNLKQLRHLFFPGYDLHRSENTLKLHTLNNLQILWNVPADILTISELERLSTSLQKLQIIGISSKEKLAAVLRSSCIKSGSLCKLNLSWAQDVELQSLKALNHCQRLRELLLRGRVGEGLPLSFPHNLAVLELSHSELKLEDSVSTLGKLQFLKLLKLLRSYTGAQLTCTANSFPQLEELFLVDLLYLVEWRMEEGAMPRLKKLMITNCNKLRKLPEALKCVTPLEKLVISDMPIQFCCRLEPPLHDREKVGTSKSGEDWHIIQHIPSVQVDHFQGTDQ